MSLHMNSILCSQLFMYIAYDVCFFCASQMKMRPYANKCFAFVIAFIIFQRWWTIETFNFICAGVCKKRAIEKFMRCYTFWCDIKCMCATASVGAAAAVTVIIVNGTYVLWYHMVFESSNVARTLYKVIWKLVASVAVAIRVHIILHGNDSHTQTNSLTHTHIYRSNIKTTSTNNQPSVIWFLWEYPGTVHFGLV